MRRLVTCSALAIAVALPSAAQQTSANDILNRPDITGLENQDIDANSDLLEALRRAAIKPAKFVLDKSRVKLAGIAGETARATLTVNNTGGKAGKIHGINLIGQFDGLEIEDKCPDRLEIGEACSISISFTSERARSLQTAIVMTVEGDERTEINIPVEIEFELPPVEEDPEPEPVIAQPVMPAIEEPKGPSSEDVARRYFGSMGGMRPEPAYTQRGIQVVSAPKPAPAADVSGVLYDQMRVETMTSQARYDEGIPSTKASLPVDRDKILTSDRVIKAVLETPVSNVMCGRVVAMVESDVYSATSSKPLIQAGSRVIGECGAFVGERVGVAWNRIITTDGRSISFDLEADTRDATGLGGALGRVHSSAYDRYVLPIISTMIDATAGVVFAVFGEDEITKTDEDGNETTEKSAKNEGIRLVTNEARGTAQEIISDIRDVREVAVIPAGSRIDIQISEDIYFTDTRKVVRLADMEFDVDEFETGSATRDVPQSLVLVPAEPAYEGDAVMIDGRRYKVEQAPMGDEEEDGAALRPRPITLDEIDSQGAP